MSLEPLIDLLACMEPALWLKKPILHNNPKIAEKACLPLMACMASDNSPAVYARELIQTLERLMKSSSLD